ncbi:four-carbon acid sugar kinase family protein [Xylanimonas protaetiae]|uniref:Four-carbon acid sugar kinase family protein n=1 Tax=Xylanimonas protaetiae TaxID=2509457 RepID=A0A4V0YGL8_9MICO|nr:four-carbon acid sugar kinase family protein [Xylanimonas protaetiae]QAY71661.1 four-carbon acid sugar kinase family protein [Xylanimonas protaetiae]
MIELGAVADDLTGATDLALMLTSAGYRTLVVVGTHWPSHPEADDVDAIVVALKSRTAPVADAVRDSVAATDRLRALGATRVYVKYCSTFDSTPEGNIGPVVSAVLARCGAPLTVVVPSFPATGRTVYQGHLFVRDRLLERSSMRDHPLTPMRDSDVVSVLQAQTPDTVGLVPLDVVRSGPDAVRAAVAENTLAVGSGGRARLVVVDATEDADLAVIAAATSDLPLLTGGSALAAHLPPPASLGASPAQGSATLAPDGTASVRSEATRFVGDVAPALREPDAGDRSGLVRPLERSVLHRAGPRVVLSGSASATTCRQVQAALDAGTGTRVIADVVRTPLGRETFIERMVRTALHTSGLHVVYTVGDASHLGHPADADLLELVLAEIAVRLADAGVDRLVVAGGETSGAVIGALGVRTLRLFPALSPGVGWARATREDGSTIDLVLKSGNFGTDDLFVSAWDRAPEAREPGKHEPMETA